MSSNWREILEKVERGELTAEQGAALMSGAPPAEAAGATPPPAAAEASAGEPTPRAEPDPELDARLEYWKRWWLIPLWVGLGVFIAGAGLIAWGYVGQRTFWFVCGFFPLLLGLLGIFVSWWSQTARWVHVRVREGQGGATNRVTISLPVPIKLVGWALHIFGDRIPGLSEQKAVRESLPSLFKELEQNRDPIAVEVNEKNGTEVRIYIT